MVTRPHAGPRSRPLEKPYPAAGRVGWGGGGPQVEQRTCGLLARRQDTVPYRAPPPHHHPIPPPSLATRGVVRGLATDRQPTLQLPNEGLEGLGVAKPGQQPLFESTLVHDHKPGEVGGKAHMTSARPMIMRRDTQRKRVRSLRGSGVHDSAQPPYSMRAHRKQADHASVSSPDRHPHTCTAVYAH